VAANVYGLRLLADVRIQRLGLAVVAGLAITYRLLQLPATPADHVGYDFRFYWTAASQLLHGQAIYSAEQLAGPYAPQGQVGFLYPPPLAALVTPLAALFPSDPIPGLWIWSGLGAIVLAASILALARAERLDERFPILTGGWVWLLVAAAFALPPVVDELVNGNVHLFLVGLLTAAWLGLRRGDVRGTAVAGVAIGIATVIKLFPALLLLWLALRGRWRPIGWAILGAGVLALVTLPITGLEPWTQYPTVLANMAAPIDTSAALSPVTWLAPMLGFDAAKLLVWAAVVVAVVWVARSPGGDRLGFAAVTVLALVATPALWTHYLSILVLPLLLALATGVAPAVIVLAYLLLSAGYQAALGDAAWITARLLPTLGLLLVLGALLWRIRSARAAPASPTNPAAWA
jgi:hypothetical protein